MKRTYPLPIELLFEIVKESVSIPEFLDVNHIPEIGIPLVPPPPIGLLKYNHEDTYWQINRHLNVLRRVCKSFDGYLRRFEHRFIRITDVYHGDVPITALLKAIRIDFQPDCTAFRYVSFARSCKTCWPSGSPPRVTSFLSAVPDQDFIVEIVTGTFNTYETITLGYSYPSRSVSEFIGSVHQRLPSLKAIFDLGVNGEENGEHLTRILNSNYIPQLQFLQFVAPADLSVPSFTARNLTTFEYYNYSEPFPEWMKMESAQTQLPALQHLHFIGVGSYYSTFEADEVIAVLKVFGHQLRSLRIGGGDDHSISDQALPAECLELCPQLERLDTGRILEISSPPPPSPRHPLHTISFFSPIVYFRRQHRYWEPFKMSFLDQLPDRSHLRRIIMQRGWNDLHRSNDRAPDDYDSRLREWLSNCARICMMKGLELEDIYGVTFENSELARKMEGMTVANVDTV